MNEEVLHSVAISTLEHLLDLANDGVAGYRRAAALVEDTAAHAFLMKCAAAREETVSVLTNLLATLGAKPRQHPSVAGSLHRGWLDVVGRASGHSVASVLRECKQGEREAIVGFQSALRKSLPPGATDVVRHQLQKIQAAAEEVSILCWRLEQLAG